MENIIVILIILSIGLLTGCDSYATKYEKNEERSKQIYDSASGATKVNTSTNMKDTLKK